MAQEQYANYMKFHPLLNRTPSVIYNLLFLIGEFKINNINFIKKEKIMTQLEINLVIKKNFKINIFMNINSNQNLHKIELADLKNSYKLINT